MMPVGCKVRDRGAVKGLEDQFGIGVGRFHAVRARIKTGYHIRLSRHGVQPRPGRHQYRPGHSRAVDSPPPGFRRGSDSDRPSAELRKQRPRDPSDLTVRNDHNSPVADEPSNRINDPLAKHYGIAAQ